jgi:hypothetical protein
MDIDNILDIHQQMIDMIRIVDHTPGAEERLAAWETRLYKWNDDVLEAIVEARQGKTFGEGPIVLDLGPTGYATLQEIVTLQAEIKQYGDAIMLKYRDPE